MPISLNSVLHYTPTLLNLKGILSEGFRVKYCLENLIGTEAAFPMVSFCDIPLSDAIAHSQAYGQFAIGLKKEWAYEKRLNPVLYVSRDSFIDNTIKLQFAKLSEDFKAGKQDNDGLFYTIGLVSLLSFVKSVRGSILKNGQQTEIQFYNEREWRYVPTKDDLLD